MKLLYITNIPSPYRVDYFNELGKYCELTVLFERNSSSERDSSWDKYRVSNFNGIFLEGLKVGTDKAFCPNVGKYLNKNQYDHIISTDFLTPTGMLAIALMRKRGIAYYLESDGGIAKNEQEVKARLKRHFIRDAKGYFSTSIEHDRYYLSYGAEKDRIIRYPFSSVYDNQVLNSPVADLEKSQIRTSLGIREQKVVLAVGQFIHRKGFDVLIKSARSFNDTGFYFVGGEPTEEYQNLKSDYENIHFVGFMEPKVLSEFYKAADVFVLPTREDIWGLVINEAMAHGLPVITTTACLAGTQMIVDGENGYLVEPEDEQSLSLKIRLILEDAAFKYSMSENALQTAKQYTIETMVNKHLACL